MANNQKKVLDQESVGYVLLNTIFRDVSAVLIKEDGTEEKFLNEMGVKNKVGLLASNINKELIEKHGLDVTHLLKELTIEYYFENDQFFLKYQFVNLWNNFRIDETGRTTEIGKLLSPTLHEEVEDSIAHIKTNFNEEMKGLLLEKVLDLLYDEHPEFGKTLKLSSAKYFKYLIDECGFDIQSYLTQIDGLIAWDVKLESSAAEYINEFRDAKNIKDQQPSKKSKTKYPLLEKYNLSSKEAVTVYLLDRMIMADGNKDQRESIAFVKITLGKPELIPFIMNVSDAFDNASENDDLDKLVDVSIKYVANEMSSKEIKDLLAYLAKIIVADEVFDASENKLLRKCCEAWDGALGWDAYASLVSFIEVKYGITIDDLGTSEDDSKFEKQNPKKSIQDSKKTPAWIKIKAAMEFFGTDYVATNKEIMDYCNEHYGEVKDSTFRTYIISCTVNHDTRVHYSPNKKPRTELLDNDVLFQVEKGKVCLYDPEKHGLWHIKLGDDGKLHPVIEYRFIMNQSNEVTLWGKVYSVEDNTDLFLNGAGLIGEIPPEIGELTNLTRLDLSCNELTGEIPPEIGELTNLTKLNLSENHLTGEVLPEIGELSNLKILDLSNNELTGSIPQEIWSLKYLEVLCLSKNQLIGEIPPEIGNIPNLRVLELYHNNLTGSIPKEMGNLINMEYLRLNDNHLSGEIPSEICNLSVEWEETSSFNILNNQLCPPYPPCIENYVGQQKEVGVYIYFDSRQTWNALVDNGYGGGNKGDVFVNEDEFQGYINIGSFQDLVDVVLVLNETLYYEPVHINSCLELGFDSGEFEESIAEVFGPETAEKWINDIYDHIKSRADLDK